MVSPCPADKSYTYSIPYPPEWPDPGLNELAQVALVAKQGQPPETIVVPTFCEEGGQRYVRIALEGGDVQAQSWDLARKRLDNLISGNQLLIQAAELQALEDNTAHTGDLFHLTSVTIGAFIFMLGMGGLGPTMIEDISTWYATRGLWASDILRDTGAYRNEKARIMTEMNELLGQRCYTSPELKRALEERMRHARRAVTRADVIGWGIAGAFIAALGGLEMYHRRKIIAQEEPPVVKKERVVKTPPLSESPDLIRRDIDAEFRETLAQAGYAREMEGKLRDHVIKHYAAELKNVDVAGATTAQLIEHVHKVRGKLSDNSVNNTPEIIKYTAGLVSGTVAARWAAHRWELARFHVRMHSIREKARLLAFQDALSDAEAGAAGTPITPCARRLVDGQRVQPKVLAEDGEGAQSSERTVEAPTHLTPQAYDLIFNVRFWGKEAIAHASLLKKMLPSLGDELAAIYASNSPLVAQEIRRDVSEIASVYPGYTFLQSMNSIQWGIRQLVLAYERGVSPDVAQIKKAISQSGVVWDWFGIKEIQASREFSMGHAISFSSAAQDYFESLQSMGSVAGTQTTPETIPVMTGLPCPVSIGAVGAPLPIPQPVFIPVPAL